MKNKSKKSSIVLAQLPLFAYLTEVQVELVKITWPNRQQIIRLTSIVVIASVATAAYLGTLDYIFVNLIKYLLNS